MSERWYAPPRLAGYESWAYQMPSQGSVGDILVSAPYPTADTPPGESPNRWLIALVDVAWWGKEDSRLKTALEDEVLRLVPTVTDPASLLAALNHFLMDLTDGDALAAAVVAVIDGNGHHLSLCIAGSVPPLLRRSNGRVEALAEEECGLPLGVERGQTYETVTVPVDPGDVVVLSSDGVTAVDDPIHRLFDWNSLRRAIIRAPGGPAAVGQSVLESVRRFGGGRPQPDDITLVCLGRTA